MLSDHPLDEYFRLPASLMALDTDRDLSAEQGYFRFQDAMCYGRLATATPSGEPAGHLVDAMDGTKVDADRVQLPFDFAQVVTNLRQEQYHQNGYNILHRVTSSAVARQVYYFFRPSLSVGSRRHLQKIRLSGWDRIAFPRWPVDTSVDDLMRAVLGLLIKQNGGKPVPFVWFWPDGAECAVMMTHDVEGADGLAFCERLMDLDDAHGVKSAFQLIPEGQAEVWRTLAERIRRRGFEVNLHDWNHDGFLFDNHQQFLERANAINRHAREYSCSGFRSGAMYREQQWYAAFDLAYDMSVPNVAHLEPQRGGCCTVMPYFVGDILELPLTTLQDYSLFHILDDYSVALWQRQIAAIREQNGLITFLAHPDYIAEPGALGVYQSLLAHLDHVREESNVWVALPGDVNRWWRNRRQMSLLPDGPSWRIEGPDAHRARLAYAVLDGNDLRFELAA